MNQKWQPLKNCYEAELPLNLKPTATFMYRTSNNMVPLLSGSDVFSPAAFEGEYPSQDVIVVGDVTTSEYILAGAVTANRSLSYFALKKFGKFRSIIVRQPYVRPDEKPEEIVVLEGDDWRKLLIQYAEIAAEKMHVPAISPKRNITGYCSWYYYYADVTEKDFLENVKALKKARGGAFSPDVVQIDDGYQAHQGDWLSQHETWKTPMKEIAADIVAGGMTAGIWLMPFLASSGSQIYHDHREWFVRDHDGETLLIQGWSPEPDKFWACLDMTIPEVRTYIAGIFKTMYGWGFHYFKMDGLGYGLPDGVFADPDATPVSAFRLGMKTIREAVPEATLLGCCPPFMAVLGYVDMCRVSPDTSRYWKCPELVDNCDQNPGNPCIANALHCSLSRWWMYDRFFRADPDTIMARDDNAFYSIGEARLSVLSGILTGVAITSDNLGTISEERLKLLARAAGYRLKNALPWQWKLDFWPQVFTGTIDGKNGVAIFNDSETPRKYSLREIGFPEMEELLHPMGPVSGEIEVSPHDAALLIEREK